MTIKEAEWREYNQAKYRTLHGVVIKKPHGKWETLHSFENRVRKDERKELIGKINDFRKKMCRTRRKNCDMESEERYRNGKGIRCDSCELIRKLLAKLREQVPYPSDADNRKFENTGNPGKGNG